MFLDWTGLIGLQRGESKSSPKIFGLENLSTSPVQKNFSPIQSDKFGLDWTGSNSGLFAVRLHP